MTPLKTALGIVFIICLTIVIFTFFNSQSLPRVIKVKITIVRHRLYYLPDDSDLYLYYSRQALRVFNKE